MVDNSDNKMGLGTYLTPQEAQEFHKLFVSGFILLSTERFNWLDGPHAAAATTATTPMTP